MHRTVFHVSPDCSERHGEIFTSAGSNESEQLNSIHREFVANRGIGCRKNRRKPCSSIAEVSTMKRNYRIFDKQQNVCDA